MAVLVPADGGVFSFKNPCLLKNMGRRWTKEDVYYLLGVYPDEEMGVRFEGGDVVIEKALARENAPYVGRPAEEEIYGRLDGGRLLVVRGPKGDGLSVAVTVALARKILSDRAVVVDVLLRTGLPDGAADLRDIVGSIEELGRKPILYLDISRQWQYPLRPWETFSGYVPHGLDRLVDALEDLDAVLEDREATTVIVLSDDLYEVLRRKLKKHAVVEVSSNADFLKRLVQTYSNCGEDIAYEVAETVAEKYDCGRAVLAVLAADLLSRHNCDRGAVDKALEVAEHRAKKFIDEYILYTLLNEDWQYAEMHAPLILLRHFRGPMPVETAEKFLINLGFPRTCVRESLAVKWIAMRHCNLINDAIKDIAELDLKGELYDVMMSARVDYYEHFRIMGYFK
jgi:hypothetical protein